MQETFLIQTIARVPVEPVTLDQVKEHLRVSNTDTDSILSAYIEAARNYVENATGRSLVTQTIRFTMSQFYDHLYLPKGSVQSISHVRYVDSSGAEQTVDPSNYVLVGGGGDASYIQRAQNGVWPAHKCQANAVRITYVAGYPPSSDSPTNYAANIPTFLKVAIYMLVQSYYDDLKGEDRDALLAVINRNLWQYKLANF